MYQARVAARARARRHGHLRADEARALVTDMLQGGSDVDLLYSWRWGRAQAAQGCPKGSGLRKPGDPGLEV